MNKLTSITEIPDVSIKEERSDLNISSNSLDLRRFLFKGSCEVRLNKGFNTVFIEKGSSWKYCEERLEVIIGIKDFFEEMIVLGRGFASIKQYYECIRQFFKYCDKKNKEVSFENLKDCFIDYSEYLFFKVNSKKASQKTSYTMLCLISNLFGHILKRSTLSPLIKLTRVKEPPRSRRAISKTQDKQNLEELQKFGQFIYELNKGINEVSVLGRLPFIVETPQANVVMRAGLRKGFEVAETEDLFRHRRYYLANLRVALEVHLFVSDTSINLEQLKNLKLIEFDYKKDPHDKAFYEVRAYKNRASGEVRFRVSENYRKDFEKYLGFIKTFFPSSGLLFPFYSTDGKKVIKPYDYNRNVRNLCKEYGVPYIAPKVLRKAKGNWILRRSQDENLASAVLQNSLNVFQNNYELPSQQKAIVEVTRFWSANNPLDKKSEKKHAVIGVCEGDPVEAKNKPRVIVAPNCINPSGCLWCENHRDINSEEYVWLLETFRYLKKIEASNLLPHIENTSSDLVITKLTDKIEWFKASTPERNNWVLLAKEKIEEGDYHPAFSAFIEVLE